MNEKPVPKSPQTVERKEEKEKTEPAEDTSSSSREMCAYCETSITVSSKFYNIMNVGDLEYIGRRLNHLGPKKNPFGDRVCKKHYDLNLKRDKAQKQYNAKQERLPGIDIIFGPSKKHSGSVQSQSTDYSSPQMQAETWHTAPGQAHVHLPVMGGNVAVQKPLKSSQEVSWAWENRNLPMATGEAKPPLVPPATPTDIHLPPLPQVDSTSPIPDIVYYHMKNILALFSSNIEHTYMINFLKQQGTTQEESITINALCTETHSTISQLLQAEAKEKRHNEQLSTSVRDLMMTLLKKENQDENVSLEGDEEIQALFIEWVNLQKSKQGQ